MIWTWTVLAALLGAVVGGIGGLLVSDRCVKWYAISSREGASGYYMIVMALFGAVGGLVVALVAAIVAARSEATANWLQVPIGVGAVVAALALWLLVAWLGHLSRLEPAPPGPPKDIEFEIMLPAGEAQRPTWTADQASLELVAVGGRGRQFGSQKSGFDLAAARLENGRWVLPARVELFSGANSQCVNLILGDRRDGFWPELWRRPMKVACQSWTDWTPTNHGLIADGKAIPPDLSKTRYRFRFRERLASQLNATAANSQGA